MFKTNPYVVTLTRIFSIQSFPFIFFFWWTSASFLNSPSPTYHGCNVISGIPHSSFSFPLLFFFAPCQQKYQNISHQRECRRIFLFWHRDSRFRSTGRFFCRFQEIWNRFLKNKSPPKSPRPLKSRCFYFSFNFKRCCCDAGSLVGRVSI